MVKVNSKSLKLDSKVVKVDSKWSNPDSKIKNWIVNKTSPKTSYFIILSNTDKPKRFPLRLNTHQKNHRNTPSTEISLSTRYFLTNPRFHNGEIWRKSIVVNRCIYIKNSV